jgi:nitrite reductase (NO-forming)
MLAAAAAGVVYAFTGYESLRWLALHLALLGGVSQLVLGAGQFFTCAFLATDPPSRRLVGAQLAAWNVGSTLVAVGVFTNVAALFEPGSAILASAIVLFALALRGMERRSLQRAPWALRWYQAAATFLAVGGLLGVLLARATVWSHGNLLGAHLALTLGGWLGTAIIGTLHTFFPSLTHTQLRHPRLQGATYALWLVGVVELAGGAAFSNRAVMAIGWTDLLVAAGLLCTNLVASLRAAPQSPPLAPRLLAVGQAFLLAGLTTALAGTVAVGAAGPFIGSWGSSLLVLLLVGWIGLTVVGSLLHLLAILARIRRFTFATPSPRQAPDRLVSALAATAVVALALSHALALAPLRSAATVFALAVGALLAVRVMQLAARALLPSLPVNPPSPGARQPSIVRGSRG